MPHSIHKEICEGVALCVEACPVNCIQWVKFEDLKKLRDELANQGVYPLGMLPKVLRRIKPGKSS